jgi:quercetin dioxygenase-like cupin family protein
MTDIEVQFIKTGKGETFTIGPIIVRVLEDGSHTDNRVGAVEIIVPPATDQTPLHLHRMHDETFLVTKGAIRFNTGDKSFDAQAGNYVVIPFGVRRWIGNGQKTSGKIVNLLQIISMLPLIRQAANEYKANLQNLYGKELAEAILFGSYARGNNRDESDAILKVWYHDFVFADVAS